MKIVIADCSWGSIDVEKQYLPPGADVVGGQCRTEAEVLALCEDADAILAEYAPLSAAVLPKLKKCKIISNTAIGYDNIDVKAASALNIAVANVPGYCAYEVADHAMALLLALNRNIVGYERSIREGIWDINCVPPMKRLAGQTIALLGFGNIAQMVAVRAAAFGMRVLAYSPSVSRDFAAAFNVRLVSIEEALSQADVVSVHLPLRENTVGFLDAGKFALMERKPVFINTARGKVVNEQALIEALKAGTVSAAGLDVLAEEPPSFDSELFELANVLITPHAGFSSETALEEVRRRSAQNVANFFAGRYSDINILNKETLQYL